MSTPQSLSPELPELPAVLAAAVTTITSSLFNNNNADSHRTLLEWLDSATALPALQSVTLALYTTHDTDAPTTLELFTFCINATTLVPGPTPLSDFLQTLHEIKHAEGGERFLSMEVEYEEHADPIAQDASSSPSLSSSPPSRALPSSFSAPSTCSHLALDVSPPLSTATANLGSFLCATATVTVTHIHRTLPPTTELGAMLGVPSSSYPMTPLLKKRRLSRSFMTEASLASEGTVKTLVIPTPTTPFVRY